MGKTVANLTSQQTQLGPAQANLPNFMNYEKSKTMLVNS